MFKLALLLKRKPGSSVENFQAYWRGPHGAVAAKIPGLRRYVQSHALPQGYRKGELLFDGVAELWFDSAEGFGDAQRSPEFAESGRDLAAFTDTSRAVVMPLDVHVIKDGDIPPNAVKNIEFVNRRPGMALEPFRAYWLSVHGPLAARIPSIRRYEQNHLQAAAYDGEAPPYDGLAVTWFDSTNAMRQGTLTPEYAETRADERHFLPDTHLPIIITREHVVVG